MSVPGVNRDARFGESPASRAAMSTPSRPPSRYTNDCSVSMRIRPSGMRADSLCSIRP